jgi:hypothetical protein
LSRAEGKIFKDAANIAAIWRTDLNPAGDFPTDEQIANLRANYDDRKVKALFDVTFGKGAAECVLDIA